MQVRPAAWIKMFSMVESSIQVAQMPLSARAMFPIYTGLRSAPPSEVSIGMKTFLLPGLAPDPKKPSVVPVGVPVGKFSRNRVLTSLTNFAVGGVKGDV